MSLLTEEERAAWSAHVPEPPNRTDAGNGEYFARLYGDRVRYDHRRRRWLVWAGNWWREDDVEVVRRLAKEAARERYQRALEIHDLEHRKGEARFAIGSENRQRIEAMLTAARAEPPIADPGDSWDSDSWLLGVANGVVDLRGGLLRAGAAADRITLHIPIAFDPRVSCPRWESFLDEIFQGDQELIDYVWRAIGYSLTGDIREQCMFMCYGSGSNGKSVFLAMLRELAGEYAANTPFSTFEFHDRASIPNDLAALVGRRLVTASETGEGRRLNEARLKALTGGDAVTARFLHGEYFTYPPVLKLWLAVNHKPRVTDDSYGFWRRVRLIPFPRRFAGMADDKELIDKLRAELRGILAWAVRGAVIWREEGLHVPVAVTSATETYRVESDPLGDFLETCCVVANELQAPAAALHVAYRRWAQKEGLSDREMLTATAFGKRMTARFTKKGTNAGKVYFGLGLLDDHPEGSFEVPRDGLSDGL